MDDQLPAYRKCRRRARIGHMDSRSPIAEHGEGVMRDPHSLNVNELKSMARKIARARDNLMTVMNEAATTAIKASEDGVPESEIARDLGVNRLTVRRWLGKN